MLHFLDIFFSFLLRRRRPDNLNVVVFWTEKFESPTSEYCDCILQGKGGSGGGGQGINYCIYLRGARVWVLCKWIPCVSWCSPGEYYPGEHVLKCMQVGMRFHSRSCIHSGAAPPLPWCNFVAAANHTKKMAVSSPKYFKTWYSWGCCVFGHPATYRKYPTNTHDR